LGLQARGYRLLDLLILKSLKLGPMHGFGISVLIRRMSEEVSRVEQDWGAR
jgi:DNA-binding PadR family transcriptional regulator